MSSYPWRSAWIVGASSGIGLEIARKLANGGVRVVISARSADALAAEAASNSKITTAALDVTDMVACDRVAGEVWDELDGIDLIILNAGVWHPMGTADFDAAKIRQSMEVNYFGLVNVIGPLLPRLKERGKGHLAMTASVAGYRGLPKALAYGPSKAAAISLAEVLEPDLGRHGVTVSVINPGFVDTPMTKVNDFPMPFLMKADKAADAVIRGLTRRRFEIAFPWQLVTILKLLRILPYPVYLWIATHMMGDGGKSPPAAK